MARVNTFPDRIPLADEAKRRGISYRRAFDLMLKGEIEAERGAGGRWFAIVRSGKRPAKVKPAA
jgi:hypothetical protein